MKFNECKTLQEFNKFFYEIGEVKFKRLSPYNTVVYVVYDSHNYNSIPMFVALYRQIGYINHIEADEIESQFQLYLELLYT